MRDRIAALYGAAGYAVAAESRPDLLLLRREGGMSPEAVAVYLPLLSTPAATAEPALAEIARLRAEAPDRPVVVALDTPLALGPAFQSQTREAGAALRAYADLLDGVYGGQAIGLGGQRGAADRLRRSLVNYGRVDPDLLSAVLRKRQIEAASASAPSRARQRFYIRDGLRPSDRLRHDGGDLLTHLAARFAQPPMGPEVYLVVGPGGSGKSFFFEGLFTYLDEAFQKAKGGYALGVRPVPVMPDSLLAAGARASEDLFDAVARTEYGAIRGLGLLAHQVTAGANVLMFDGLDEYFAGSGDLAEDIAKRFFTPGSKARIVIVLRDSLLDTSPAVRTMATRFAEALGDNFSIYELALWDEGDGAAQRELAWLKLHGRRPAHGEPDSVEVRGFFEALDAGGPRLRDLCRLAFYCDLMIDLFKEMGHGATVESASGRPTPETEYDLLDHCFERILDRELAKMRPGDEEAPVRAFLGADAITKEQVALAQSAVMSAAIDPTAPSYARLLEVMFADQASGGDPERASARIKLRELVEEAAYLHRRGGPEAALTAERLKALYDDAAMTAGGADRDLGIRMLRQFVLFEQGGEDGTVGFTHDFMADFLAARFVERAVKRGDGDRATLSGQPARGETDVFNGYLDSVL